MAMTAPFSEIGTQFHEWPWSAEVKGETFDLLDQGRKLNFFGSPTISVSTGFKVFLPTASDQLHVLGPDYDRFQLHEPPHGIISEQKKDASINIISPKQSFSRISLSIQGAAQRYLVPDEGMDGKVDSVVGKIVIAWAQVFEDLAERARKANPSSNEISWPDVLSFFNEIADPDNPRMALIVKIASRLSKRVPETTKCLRRILLRERSMVTLSHVQELDTKCINWYVRQPGRTTEQKAGPKQQLLAVVRREFLNTLENRVLKDFLVRCKREGGRYLFNETSNSPQRRSSLRAKQVQSYKNICSSSLNDPTFELIHEPPHGLQPNYVLQNDNRYSEIWKWYIKLLRRQHEEDRIWEWQSRTWSDVVRLFIGSALELIKSSASNKPEARDGLLVESVADSCICIFTEQRSGSRIHPGSLPGPYLLTTFAGGKISKRAVLEIVHSDLADRHPICKELGSTGGHLYLVLHPVGETNAVSNVLIIWAVNSAGSTIKTSDQSISASCENALKINNLLLSRHRTGFPSLSGMVISSIADSSTPCSFFRSDNVSVLSLPAEPILWEENIMEVASELQRTVEALI